MEKIKRNFSGYNKLAKNKESLRKKVKILKDMTERPQVIVIKNNRSLTPTFLSKREETRPVKIKKLTLPSCSRFSKTPPKLSQKEKPRNPAESHYANCKILQISKTPEKSDQNTWRLSPIRKWFDRAKRNQIQDKFQTSTRSYSIIKYEDAKQKPKEYQDSFSRLKSFIQDCGDDIFNWVS